MKYSTVHPRLSEPRLSEPRLSERQKFSLKIFFANQFLRKQSKYPLSAQTVAQYKSHIQHFSKNNNFFVN